MKIQTNAAEAARRALSSAEAAKNSILPRATNRAQAIKSALEKAMSK